MFVDLQKLAALRDADILLRGDYRRRSELARDALSQSLDRQANYVHGAGNDAQKQAIQALLEMPTADLQRQTDVDLKPLGLTQRMVRNVIDDRARVAALQADAQAMAPRVYRSSALIAKLESFALGHA